MCRLCRSRDVGAQFSLDKLNLAAAVLNPKKLLWFNKRQLQRPSMRDEHIDALLPAVRERYGAAPHTDRAYVARVFDVLDSRVATRAQWLTAAAPFFAEPDWAAADAQAFRAEAWRDAPSATAFVRALRASLAAVDDWSHADFDAHVVGAGAASALPLDAARKALRYAVTAARVGAPMVPTLSVLGRDVVLRRLDKAIADGEDARANQTQQTQ